MCKADSKAEVVFVIDSSSSIGESNWKLVLEFLSNMVKQLHIGSSATRVALVTYSSVARVEFDLSSHTSKSGLLSAISRVKLIGGLTATGDALALALTAVLSKARAGVPKIVILITDGIWNYGTNPIKEAAKLKASGVTLFTVGIGSDIKK